MYKNYVNYVSVNYVKDVDLAFEKLKESFPKISESDLREKAQKMMPEGRATSQIWSSIIQAVIPNPDAKKMTKALLSLREGEIHEVGNMDFSVGIFQYDAELQRWSRCDETELIDAYHTFVVKYAKSYYLEYVRTFRQKCVFYKRIDGQLKFSYGAFKEGDRGTMLFYGNICALPDSHKSGSR